MRIEKPTAQPAAQPAQDVAAALKAASDAILLHQEFIGSGVEDTWGGAAQFGIAKEAFINPETGYDRVRWIPLTPDGAGVIPGTMEERPMPKVLFSEIQRDGAAATGNPTTDFQPALWGKPILVRYGGKRENKAGRSYHVFSVQPVDIKV